MLLSCLPSKKNKYDELPSYFSLLIKIGKSLAALLKKIIKMLGVCSFSGLKIIGTKRQIG
jgi:hypothetical protein